MYHFDTPSVFGTPVHYPLYNAGVFNIGLNNDTIVDSFVNYARILFAHYADRVPYWISKFTSTQCPLELRLMGTSVQ